jgi:hypothetical protein
VGSLLALSGLPSLVARGQCTFLLGPEGDLPPVGIVLDRPGSHAWLRLEFGVVDLSPKLQRQTDIRWRGVNSPGVIGQFVVHDRKASTIVLRDDIQYEQAVAVGTHVEGGCGVVYWVQLDEAFDVLMLTDPRSHINSPLTDQLSARFDSGIYLKLVNHLHGVLSGDTKPLASVSRWRAWEIVDRQTLDPQAVADQISEAVTKTGAPPG